METVVRSPEARPRTEHDFMQRGLFDVLAHTSNLDQ